MSLPTSPPNVLSHVHQLAADNRILVDWPEGGRADHVARRMGQRGVRARDIRYALEHGTKCEPGEGKRLRWKITGPDLDSDPLTVVVELDGPSYLLVITLY